MQRSVPVRFKIVMACVISILGSALVLFFLNAGSVFDGIKKNEVLSKLGLPETRYCSLVSHAQCRDFLKYIDEYDWSIIDYGAEDSDQVMDSMQNNDLWHTEQVSFSDILSVTSVLPGDSNGLRKTVPFIESGYDAWYFDYTHVRSGDVKKLESIADLKAYCGSEVSFACYTIVFYNKSEGILWYLRLN